jgi:GNAT superfamily N-acetyltransferase
MSGEQPTSPLPRLTTERFDSDVAQSLVAALLDDLRARYGAEDPDAPHADELAPPRGTFLVAWLANQAVGCGGVRAHAEDGVGEIKRMYTVPAARRQGIAAAILDELEQRARGIGYRRLVLETGVRQPEAIALYESFGYVAVPPYGQYADHPTSRCFAKDLGESLADG